MTIEERLKDIIKIQSDQIEFLLQENKELKKQLGIEDSTDEPLNEE